MTEAVLDLSAYKAVPRDFRFQYKSLPGVENGGPHVDIYLPSGEPANKAGFPLMLMYHGGGMIIGTSRHIPLKQVRYLLSQGVAVAPFEYRLVPHVHIPEIRSDLLDGYRYVQTELNDALKQAGASDRLVDVTRCAAAGWSAGASLFSSQAADILSVNSKGQEHVPPLKAIIPAYPLTDFSLFDQPINSDPESDIQKAFVELQKEPCAVGFHIPGAPPTERDSFNSEAPLSLSPEAADEAKAQELGPRAKWCFELTKGNSLCTWMVGHNPPFERDVSPGNLVTKDFPPTFVFVAEANTLIPPKHSYDLYESMKAEGVDVEIGVGKGMGHGQIEGLGQWEKTEEEKGWWGQVVLPALTFALKRLV